MSPQQLLHPQSLQDWHRAQSLRNPVGKAKYLAKALMGRPGPAHTLLISGKPQILSVVEGFQSSNQQAFIHPLREQSNWAVLAPTSIVPRLELPASSVEQNPPIQIELPQNRSAARATLTEHLPEVHSVLLCGNYLALSHNVWTWAEQEQKRVFISQHGLITPHAPPLPAGSHLLAWNENDAEYWISGRSDITYSVTGSQLFWNAQEAARNSPHQAPDAHTQPMFLGQLHGTELPTRLVTRISAQFCQNNHAIYRPHPAENTRYCQRTHTKWEAKGIAIDRSQTPLYECGHPLVGIFSTGLLEGSARGIPTWGYAPDAPEWIADFWKRYRINAWGDEPSPPPWIPEISPHRTIQETITDP